MHRPRAQARRLLLVGLVLLPYLFTACSDVPTKPTVGQTAPDFELTALDGTRYRLSDLRGKVVFINLWATWCPPCRQEMPSMVLFYNAFRERGVEVLAISEDTDVAAVRKMIAQFGVKFPVLMDENKRIYSQYRATGVPETHLIDREGVLRNTVIGPFDWTSPEVLETVRSLLGA